MFQLIERERKTSPLTRPLLPCLSKYHTMNLTCGCPNECVYCYAQSYDFHPGWGTVIYYSNMLEKLKKSLPRMRKKPELVYFSTASEPFLPIERILDDLYEIMSMLLKNNIFLLISTKCVIPDKFIALFKNNINKVHVQVGITTSNDRIRQVLEPRASSVNERLDNLNRLIAAGIKTEARMDPLTPGLTDTNESIKRIFKKLRDCGIKSGTASFMFLRYGIALNDKINFDSWSLNKMAQEYYNYKVTDYCGSGTIWLPSTEYRKNRLATIKNIAGEFGIDIHLCRCKNKDITNECCHPVMKNSSLRFVQGSFL